MPRPALRHARASTRLTIELGGPFDRGRGGPGGWHLLDEPEQHFPDPTAPGEVELLRTTGRTSHDGMVITTYGTCDFDDKIRQILADAGAH